MIKQGMEHGEQGQGKGNIRGRRTASTMRQERLRTRKKEFKDKRYTSVRNFLAPILNSLLFYS